jgi:DNA-binding FrmR family transcriptional regulator
MFSEPSISFRGTSLRGLDQVRSILDEVPDGKCDIDVVTLIAASTTAPKMPASRAIRRDQEDTLGKVEVSNEELRTVRDAMRELNRMVDLLERGDSEKFVLTKHGQMRAVVLSVESFAELRQPPSNRGLQAAA